MSQKRANPKSSSIVNLKSAIWTILQFVDIRQYMISRMETFTPAEAPAAPPLRDRGAIPDRFKWNLTHIFPDADAWKRAYDELDTKISAYAALQGTLAQGPPDGNRLLAAYRISDEIGQISIQGLVYYVALKYCDEDQRDNEINAKRQQVT